MDNTIDLNAWVGTSGTSVDYCASLPLVNINTPIFNQEYIIQNDIAGYYATGFSINNDGTFILLVDYTTRILHGYTLSSPYDVSTMVYQGAGTNLNGVDTQVQGCCMSRDGSVAYACGYNNGYAAIYKLPMSSNFDVTTMSYQGDYIDLSVSGAYIRDIQLSCCGRYFYYINDSSAKLYQFELSTEWDIMTATYLASASFPSVQAFCMSARGDKLFVSNTGTEVIYQYPLGTNYMISTLGSSDASFSIGALETGCRGIAMNHVDNSNILILGTGRDRMMEYTNT